jgi:ABC-type sulfate transport system permease component
MQLAVFTALESDLNAAVALSVLVLGFSFTVILIARTLAKPPLRRSWP